MFRLWTPFCGMSRLWGFCCWYVQAVKASFLVCSDCECLFLVCLDCERLFSLLHVPTVNVIFSGMFRLWTPFFVVCLLVCSDCKRPPPSLPPLPHLYVPTVKAFFLVCSEYPPPPPPRPPSYVPTVKAKRTWKWRSRRVLWQGRWWLVMAGGHNLIQSGQYWSLTAVLLLWPDWWARPEQRWAASRWWHTSASQRTYGRSVSMVSVPAGTPSTGRLVTTSVLDGRVPESEAWSVGPAMAWQAIATNRSQHN